MSSRSRGARSGQGPASHITAGPRDQQATVTGAASLPFALRLGHRRLPVLLLGALLVLLLACAAPALAAAPEEPEVSVKTPLLARQATLHGVLNPNAAGEEGTYEFSYRADTKKECTGAGAKLAPEPAGTATGEQHEEVPAQVIAGLTPSTEYAVCLIAENAAKQRTSSAVLTFKTTAAAKPEKPTLEVETPLPGGPTPATSAVVHGVLNPNAEGEPGTYEFMWAKGSSCEAESESSGLSFGAQAEPVSETLGSQKPLQPGTVYSVCLRAINGAKELTQSNPVTFKTAITPETPFPREPESVTATSAVLRAELNPHAAGESSSYQFFYGQNGECTTAGPSGTSAGAKGEIVTGEAPLEGLEPDRQYTFCLIVTNGALESGYSPTLSFRTLAPAPAVKSQAATPVGPFEEHLEATVDPENQTTGCTVEYGETTAYGTTRPCDQASIEGGEQPVTLNVTGLAANSPYDYRFVLTNAAHETTFGEGTFSTATALPPAIEAETAAPVTALGATFQAQVNPEFQPTTFRVEYSTEESVGVLTGAIGTAEGSETLTGGANVTATATTTALLAPGTTYFFRAVAENATAPVTEGPVGSFTTPPLAETEAATAVTATSATLNGKLKPLNATVPTEYHFVYEQGGECNGPGHLATSSEEAGTGAGTEVSATPANIENLQPGAAYTACLVTTNTSGEQVGTRVHFATPVAAPKVDGESTGSEEAGTLTPFEARLEAQVDPDGQETHYSFEYSTSESTGVLTGTVTTVKGAAAIPAGAADVTATVATGRVLEPGKTYFYRAVAENASAGQAAGPVQSFATPAAKAPELFTETASEITPSTAELEAQVFPQYQTATVTFYVAETETKVLHNEGTTFTAPAVAPGSIAEGFPTPTVSAQATGLSPNHTYYYRAAAENTAGDAVQNLTVQKFTTTTTPALGGPSSGSVTATGATVTGTVNPEGSPTTYFVQYGGTTEYGQATSPRSAGSGTGPIPVEVPLEGLEPGRTYHYRLVAENTTGGTPYVGYGEDGTFTTTSTPPTLTGLTAAAVGQSTATITATLNPQGLSTHWELQLGATPGNLQPITSGQDTTETALSIPVGNLTPGTFYYYRLTATNADGTVAPEAGLTTLPGPAPAGGQPGLPALIPYTPITTITARQEAEDKHNAKSGKPLTNRQKLAKALRQCRKDKKKSRRQSCEKQAHRRYPTAKKKG